MKCSVCGFEHNEERCPNCGYVSFSPSFDNGPVQTAVKAPVMAKKKKRSVCLLISAILGIAYAIYLVVYFTGINVATTGSIEAISSGLATAMVMPHMVCVVVAAIFNILGWALNNRAFALVGGILYAVSMVFMFIYAFFVIVQMILSFVGFANLKKINAINHQ